VDRDLNRSVASSQIYTIPNAISVLRGLGIPIFLWSYLHAHNVALSFAILVIGGLTDYLDGKIARALKQESALGELLDPSIDRAYIAAVLIAMSISGALPIWIPIVLIGRDIWLSFMLLLMRITGGGVFKVSFLGKSATFTLLYAFPLILISSEEGFGRVLLIVGWSFAIWGIALYLLTGFRYTVIALVRVFTRQAFLQLRGR
jgi:cardiolipin synthase (CMP-forming)